MLSTNSNLSSGKWTLLVGINYRSMNMLQTFTVVALKTTASLIPDTKGGFILQNIGLT